MNRLLIALGLTIFAALTARADDGSDLWLPPDRARAGMETLDIARAEVEGIGDVEFHVSADVLPGVTGPDGYTITRQNGKTVISAVSPVGVLYGAYHLQRLVRTGGVPPESVIRESPRYDLRLLNHWDNLDGTVERGYAGHSLWQWDELPGTLSPRYRQYARANASVGINGTVLNNVNATPLILRTDYLHKVKALADVFRPYGIKVYLSVNFSSPVLLGGLDTSDPLDAGVAAWWAEKADEIYGLIPDFGGFLVKANSEGQPGPQDYGRTHSDGANMLARALAPHGGIVMWRAFVYDPDSDDRARQAYDEFIGLDGRFDGNVILQVKNGPIDFQPREPFNPLFGAMERTRLMVEFQITQEYLGHSVQLAYLAPLYKECLDADTYAHGRGSTVAAVTDGTMSGYRPSAIAGVANIGLDANWTGHHFAQANWYCFGRLAWDHTLSSGQIAEEWLRMTFTGDDGFVEPVKRMMLASREAVVDYMMPLGLHHIFAEGHHYGPEPWYKQAVRPDWSSVYYHRADSTGIGFDRTSAGSNSTGQYFPPLWEIFDDPSLCPDNLLLWFHRLPWDYRMANGDTLWDNLCLRYQAGVDAAREFQKIWDSIEGKIDRERFLHVQSRLRRQASDAVWWRDACLLYFQTHSGMPFPPGMERPVHDLDELKQIRLDLKHHN